MFYYHQHASVLVCLSLLSACLSVKGFIQKYFLKEGRGGHWKANKIEQREGVLACVYVGFFKKNAEIFKMKFHSYFPILLLIIMAVRNIRQTIMEDYNIQSCQWMACHRFHQTTQDHHNVGYVKKNIYLQPLVVG